ncbi:MAG: dihydroorotate dehydrogenase-like protein [Bacteroidales bacterium]|nr:dihydroorotate dehydrogenase-like protein [Bacteroidales bacterium]
MINLSTTYLGLELKTPIIAASSGLTDNIENLLALEKAGAGAVVLKSLFEEEIVKEMQETFTKMTAQGFIYPETMEYFEYDEIQDTLGNYLKLISDAKQKLSIPVIASINCVSSQKWTYFAKELEKAGADALELNVFVMPSDFDKTAQENEKVYFDIIEEVKKQVNIPISLKMSHYFSNLGSMIKDLSNTGIGGLVLFNRFFSPDFDMDKMNIIATNVLSTPSELAQSLRWVAIASGRVDCDIAASTGVHDGLAVAKQILAGAQTVQVASVLYRNGIEYLETMLSQLNKWMEEKGYESLDDFRAQLSYQNIKNPAAYDRVQFMKNFRDYKS